ncbi:MAG TPA: UPF0149 family protein [Rubrivivax sp.]|jgi:uncharacterized protein|nr:UPF0149 family protein [Rubrivivax sp.]
MTAAGANLEDRDGIGDFDRVMRQLCGFDPTLHSEWADGFLTAVAAGPRRLETDEWLPVLTGDAFGRAFADPEDELQARAALEGRLQALRRQLDPEGLLARPDELRLEPMMEVWDDQARREALDAGAVDEAEVEHLQTGAAWAHGFLSAVDAFAADWKDPPALAEAAVKAQWLQHVDALTLPPGEALDAHLARCHRGQVPDRDQLIDEACWAVQDLRVWWLDHAARPTPRRVPAAPGRNDPCPCGSGLKFKKCHGRSD